jgi:hypothetical protein
MKLWVLLLLLFASCAGTTPEDSRPADAGYEFDVVDYEPNVDDAFGGEQQVEK